MKHKMGRGKKILNPPWDVWKSFKSPFLTIFILAKWNERRRHRRKETSFDVDVDVVKNIKSSAQRFELLIVHSPAPPPPDFIFSEAPFRSRKKAQHEFLWDVYVYFRHYTAINTNHTDSLSLSFSHHLLSSAHLSLALPHNNNNVSRPNMWMF